MVENLPQVCNRRGSPVRVIGGDFVKVFLPGLDAVSVVSLVHGRVPGKRPLLLGCGLAAVRRRDHEPGAEADYALLHGGEVLGVYDRTDLVGSHELHFFEGKARRKEEKEEEERREFGEFEFAHC